MTVTQRIRIACCVTKSADMPSEYVMLIAFPQRTVVTRTLSVSLYFFFLLALQPIVGLYFAAL